MFHCSSKTWVGALVLAATLFGSQVSAATPTLIYEATIGDRFLPRGTEITVDAAGNAYVVGSFYENQVTLDVIATKVGPDGEILWLREIIAESHDFATDLALDADGNVWVVGWTDSSDFPTTEDAYDRTLTHSAVFLTKLSSEDGSILYSTFLGGDHTDRANGIALDANGEIVIVGYTKSTDFPTTEDAWQPEPNAPLYIYRDAFLARFSADGKSLLYSTYFGGYENDTAIDVAIDSDGNLVIAGTTEAADFPLVMPLQSSPNDIFVSKLSADGSELLYSTYLGGEDYDRLWEMEVDGSDEVYLTGSTRSVNFPTTDGAFQEVFAGEINGCEVPFGADYNCEDGFLTKLRTDGTGLVFSTYLGGTRVDESHALGVAPGGEVFLTGSTSSEDFPGAENSELYYVSKLTADGSGLEYTYERYSSNSGGMGITVDDAGRIFTTGGANFPAELYVAEFMEVAPAGIFGSATDPASPQLYSSQPNPFARATSLGYSLPEAGNVSLSIFDASGRLVRTLVDQPEAAGSHRVEWDGTNDDGIGVQSGAYLYRLTWNGQSDTGRILRVR